MFCNCLAKGFALHRIVKGHIGGAFGHAGTARGNVDATQFQAAGNLLKTFAFLATHQVVPRDPEILKDQLGAIDRTVTQLFQLLANAEADSSNSCFLTDNSTCFVGIM